METFKEFTVKIQVNRGISAVVFKMAGTILEFLQFALEQNAKLKSHHAAKRT